MNTTKLDLSGLNQFSDLMKSGSNVAALAGKPLVLSLDLIEEDPRNARKKYDPEKMQELADSIRVNGLTSAIVVKLHPEDPQRYLIVHGHRRYRAHRMNGMATIEAVVTDKQGSLAQLVDNLQREDLNTLETVNGIRGLLDDGLKQVQIAEGLGKSKTWVSRYVALTDLPPALADLLDSERCRDASTLYELLQIWKKDEAATAAFLANAGDRQIVQTDVESWRAAILRGPAPAEPLATPAGAESGADTTLPAGKDPNGPTNAAESASEASVAPSETFVQAAGVVTAPAPSTSSEGSAGDNQAGDDEEGAAERKQNLKPSAAAPDPMKVRKPLVQVRVGRREAVLLIGKKATHGLVWVQYEDASEEALDVAKVKLVAVTEGAK